MRIQLKKFGTVLTSRQLGKEAFLAFQPSLPDTQKNEVIEVDFTGVTTFSPSWGDEFLTPLLERYGKKLYLLNTENPSVKVTLEFLKDLEGKVFQIVNAR